METIQAVKTRKSIRGFKKDVVPKKTLQEILEIATRSPSANNTQPWEFFVLAGEKLDEARKANIEQFEIGTKPDAGIPIPANKWSDPYRRRQVELGIELYRLLDIEKDDWYAKEEWARKGLGFFDAPAAILICVDKSNEDIVYLFDIGAIAQTIALISLEYGLGTCIQRHVTNYPDALRKAVGIPDSKRIIIGIAIGYPDMSSPTNSIQSKRDLIDTVTTWIGFE